jgi:Zn finger protein HypA/HybF involved in hydrogenase expression
MHEVAIARELVTTAVRSAEAAGLERVTRLQIELGHDAGVAPDALSLALQIVGEGTIANRAAVEFTGEGAGAHTCDPDSPHDDLFEAAARRGAIRLAWIEGE